MSDNLYFEPPSRLQLVDKLAHLLRFSNTLLVLAGPEGAGVSTVVEQLHNQAVEDDVYILSLNLTGSTNLNGLLKLLNSAMDELVNPQDSKDLDELALLHKKIETLSKLQRKLLVSIDNADLLSDEAAESLVNLLAANQGKLAVTLAGSEKLVSRAQELVEEQNLSDSLHVEILSPFNRVETEEFVQLRFLRGNDFSAKQLSEIYLNSEGYPGRITQMTSEMIKSGKIKLNGKNSILPVPHIIGIAVLLTVITGVLSWQSFSEDESEDELVASSQPSRNSLSLDLNVSDDGSATIDPNSAQSLESEIANLSLQIQAQEQLIEQAKQDSSDNSQGELSETQSLADLDIAQAADVSDNQADTEVALADQQELAGISSAPDATTVTVAAPSVSVSDNLEAPADNPVNDSVTQPVEANSDQQQQTIDTGVAAVENVVSVNQQLADLSAQLKQKIAPQMLQMPSLPKVADKKPAKTPINAQPEIKKAPLPAPAKATAPSSPVVVAQNEQGSSKWLRKKEILNWPATGYTLQLLSARSQESAIKLLKTAPNAEKMYYFQTQSGSNLRNVIIYGQYPSRAAATAAIAKLPKQLRDLKPWPKSVKTVKNSIK